MNYDYLVSTIRVTVPSYKENKTDSNAVYFTIELESDENKWYVEKRFSEFDSLVKSIKASYHNVPEIPQKGFLSFKMSDKDLDKRRKGLEQFLQKIVVRNDLMNCNHVKAFLQLDKNASEMMVNPPSLSFEYLIDGQSKGINDFIHLEQENIFIIVTADMNPVSRLKNKFSNTKKPWDKDDKALMEVGSVEMWSYGNESSKFMRTWTKGYPKEAMCLSYDKASNRILVGLDNGIIDVIQVTGNGYEDITCVECHQDKVTGLAYDAMSNIVYSVSQDKVFRVSHGSSLALIVGVPHKEPIMSMLRDTLNKRIFFGSKAGEVYIYDIAQAEKPKLLTVLQNNNKGAIRCLHLDVGRNYLFTGSYDDGELNVFDLDKPGREKYAKMNATIRGKQKVKAITWSSKRAQIITGYADGSITFWNAIEGKSIYVLQSFDIDVTGLIYLEEKESIITSSKGKAIKIWALPKEWRDAKLVADQQKKAGKRLIEHNKAKVANAVLKAGEDSDEDDLAGWHLD